MRITYKQNGFTIIEILLSLVILAMVMTAMAVALDASVINFQANENISRTTNTARAALLRMTTELRSAGYNDGSGYMAVASLNGGGTFVDTVNTQCSLVTSDGRHIAYWYDSGAKILYLHDETSNQDYVLCRNVTAATFERAQAADGTVRNVRIVLKLTDDKGDNPRTFAAAAVVRRNLN
jgi:prepilin-type N-terminal cleavage/methylation domain-containing protein